MLWSPDRGPVWVHLDRTSAESQAWLRNGADLDPHVAEGLLASTTRPRVESIGGGLFITLRGVNLNSGADPSDMISIRLWVEPHRLITLQREPLRSVAAVAERLERGEGFASVGAVLVAIINGITERMGPVVDRVDEMLDELEDRAVDPSSVVNHADLVALRQEAIMLHRHIKPQAQALIDLHAAKFDAIDAKQRRAIKEAISRVTRFVEDLDADKGRAAVIQDELANQLAQGINQRIYAVTIIAAIFLPLTFIAGLLGANVGGIPWATNPYGFVYLCIILGLIGFGAFAVVRWCKWL